MQIEVDRGGRPGRAAIITIDGKPYRLDEAAKELGLTPYALQKRLERGTPLDKPLCPRGEPNSGLLRSWRGE
jgi:hypothetical protein